MSKYVYIVGIDGNMGRRYQAILTYLKINHDGHDRNVYKEPALRKANGFRPNAKKASHFIIATPTSNHISDIKVALKYQKPILCEKPLTLNSQLLKDFETERAEDVSLITMVNQYKYLVAERHQGETYYDYFKTGNDGLNWDCINIIGLSREKPNYIKDTSPIWKACINGKHLDLSSMDFAYIRMIEDFLSSEHESNWAYAVKAHEKAEQWPKY